VLHIATACRARLHQAIIDPSKATNDLLAGPIGRLRVDVPSALHADSRFRNAGLYAAIVMLTRTGFPLHTVVAMVCGFLRFDGAVPSDIRRVAADVSGAARQRDLPPELCVGIP